MMLGIQRLHCRRVRHALWDYIAERLSEGPMEIVERHLTVCAACRRDAESMRQAQDLLTACRQKPIPPPRSDWNALRARLQTEGERTTRAIGERPHPAYTHTRHLERLTAQRRSRWTQSLAGSGAFAGVLLLVAFGYRSVQMTRLSPPSHPDFGHPRFTTGPGDALAMRSTTDSAGGTRKSAPNLDYSEDPDLYGPDLTAIDPAQRNDVQTAAPIRHSPEATHNALLVAAHSQHHGDNAVIPYHSSRIAPDFTQNRDRNLRFRPYKPRPEDALPQTEPQTDRYAMDGVVPVGNSNGGTYVMPSLSPVQSDSETSY